MDFIIKKSTPVKKVCLIKNSIVKDRVHDLGGRVEPGFISALDLYVDTIIKRSFERAKMNGRSTVLERDL